MTSEGITMTYICSLESNSNLNQPLLVSHKPEHNLFPPNLNQVYKVSVYTGKGPKGSQKKDMTLDYIEFL